MLKSLDVWRRIVHDDTKSWVLFENGTCVVLPNPQGDPSAGSGQALAEQAKALLAEYGPVHVGTPSADFDVVEPEGLPGRVVTCHHPDILTYVPTEEFGTTVPPDFLVGLLGRQMRADDAAQLKVVHVEDKRSAG